MNAAAALLPHALAAVVLWFLGTGLVLRAARAPRATYPASLRCGAAIAIAALGAIAWSLGDTTGAGAYTGFTAAIAIWGWLELAFLTGAITGPRRRAAPPGARGWPRFKAAAATLIHHEIALTLTLFALAALSWGAPNPTGALTFALLFALRLSTKLNIHAGVPNMATELLPAHLSYLASYFRRRPFGVGLTLALAATVALCVALAQASLAAPPASGVRAASALLFALAALGVVEHLFLALPVRDAALWRWALPAASRRLTLSTASATSSTRAAAAEGL